ncbi:uridine kinase [Oribacterium sp. KHPX15]|uniref:nucleoside kinase n=1 Tax=unclassified Oribacterium TaxID=2629782 RepID=UPI0004E14A5C|nr:MULTISPECIES: nucleoside kinase [unclassified Oribacterium]SDZ86447.1 uridine kinase [Oribacterium sp. KHPX15]
MIITLNGDNYEFPEGTTFLDMAKEFQSLYKEDILLARFNSVLYELFNPCKEDGNIQFITGRSKIGQMTYERSAIFMMLKAFYKLCSDVKGFEVIVDYTLGRGYYCHLNGGVEITPELLKKVKDQMDVYHEMNIPITKSSMRTNEARDFFRKVGMHSKEKLFRFRMTANVNVYDMDGFRDYFYGYMVPSTGYIKSYDLIQYGEGFVLLLPSRQEPDKVTDFVPFDKLYNVQQTSSKWAKKIGCSCIGSLNEMVVDGHSDDLILMQEALFEKTIGNIAMDIEEKKKKVVMIAGPSSSGKTTFSRRLSIQLRALGLNPHPISVDNYFRDRELAPLDENGKKDFESIKCVDVELFNNDMLKLLEGETIQLPRYNFFTGKREYKGDFCRLKPNDVLVIEGIHCLNDEMSYALSKDAKYRIYISALTQVNVDSHNRIPTTDGRLLRRIVRDNRTRGYKAKDTIAMWENVRRGENMNIFPYQESADVMVNSSMIYELPVLKIFAAPLLFQIKPTDPEYQEAKRLLKFLDYILPISPELIPQNSIIREFIGGSCLDVG